MSKRNPEILDQMFSQDEQVRCRGSLYDLLEERVYVPTDVKQAINWGRVFMWFIGGFLGSQFLMAGLMIAF